MRAHKALVHIFRLGYSEGYCSTYHTCRTFFARDGDELMICVFGLIVSTEKQWNCKRLGKIVGLEMKAERPVDV